MQAARSRHLQSYSIANGHNARVALPDPSAPFPLYGRAREVRVLDALLASVTEHGDALVLLGEPGIGKSSLVAAAAGSARASGFQILSATGSSQRPSYPSPGCIN